MRYYKFISLGIFLVSISFSYILYVPECYSCVQQAIYSAKDDDTVSVNFGRVDGSRTILTTSIMFNKAITFEVRGQGLDDLSNILNAIKYSSINTNLQKQNPPPGWEGQKWICRPDSSTDQQPCIAFDSSGCAWVVWWGYALPNYSQLYSKWNGLGWAEEKGVGPNDSGLVARARPRICFDNENTAWLVWDNFYANNNHDIAFSCWQDTCWSPEDQINLHDSTDLDFAPKISCGGGEIWCVWYGGPTDVSPYTVYASRWNGIRWVPDMQVSPADGMHHWFCDVTVDNRGAPHIVWSEYPDYWLYYRYYDLNQHSWSDPVILNIADTVMTAPWSYAAIAIDRESDLHVSWTGAYRGADTRDIFYNKCVGTQWLPTVKITQDSGHHESRSDIGVDSPDNIWIAFDRDLIDEYICVTHFDGSIWSDEERIDNDDSYDDLAPVLTLDRNGYPWVGWDGYPNYFPRCDVFYNRYVENSGVNDFNHKLETGILVMPNPFAEKLEIITNNPGQLKIYNALGKEVYSKTIQTKLIWSGKDKENRKLPKGLYFLTIKTSQNTQVKKIVLSR